MEYNPRADGIKELSKQFAVNPALVSQSIMASLEKVHSLIVWGHDKNKIPKAEEESFRLGTQMLYAIHQTELLQHPDNQELVKGLVASAEQLLYLVPNAPAATQAEWVMHRFEKMQDSSQLPMHLIENPSFLSALTDAQAQRVCPALGIALGDRARLARMLVDSLAIPDNPDWKALKEGQPLTKLIRQFATQYTKANGHRGELLLGTLDACTRHDKYGRNSARKHWEEAQRDKKPWPWSYSGNNDGFSPTPMVGATAGRNIYRAILLGQAGDYKEQSSISNKGDAIQALNSWRCDGNQGLYERALVMLDQSPTFPPIGVQQKKEARWQLTRAAADGYAPAQAKLKEL